MYQQRFDVSRTLSERSLKALAMNAETQCRIAESKNDRSAVVHCHVILEQLNRELDRRAHMV